MEGNSWNIDCCRLVYWQKLAHSTIPNGHNFIDSQHIYIISLFSNSEHKYVSLRYKWRFGQGWILRNFLSKSFFAFSRCQRLPILFGYSVPSLYSKPSVSYISDLFFFLGISVFWLQQDRYSAFEDLCD